MRKEQKGTDGKKEVKKVVKKQPVKRVPKAKLSPVKVVENKEGVKAVNVIANAMLDKKAKNVCSLDLRKIGTSICDFFVICNAESTTQVRAIADNIEDEMIVKCDKKPVREQGKENSFWIILDYGDVVVHANQCDQLGFIKFGSRLDLFLPLDAEIKVNVGDKVTACQTVIAKL